MPVPDGWNAKNAGQLRLKGQIRCKMSALEEAHEGCRRKIDYYFEGRE
jgi:hypothetical protein